MQYFIFSAIFIFSAFVPNVAFILFVLFVAFLGIKKKIIFLAYVCFVIFYLSIILSTKVLIGEGNDYITYFNNVTYGTYPSWNESKLDFFFWSIASFIMEQFSKKDSFTFFVIINIISLSPIVYVSNYIWNSFKNNDAVRILSVFFLLLIPSFPFWILYGNYIRQAWAFTFAIGFLVSILDRRYALTVIFLLIAISSHSSGILFILAIFLSLFCRKLSISKVSFYSIILCIAFVIFPTFHFLSSYFPEDMYSKLDYYSTWNGADFGKTAILRMIACYLFLYLVNLFLLAEEDKKNLIYTKMYFVFVILTIVISVISDITKVVERLYYPTLIIFFMIASMQYVFFLRRLNVTNKIIFVFASMLFGIPLLAYSFYSSLYYNTSYFNGNLIDFFQFGLMKYHE